MHVITFKQFNEIMTGWVKFLSLVPCYGTITVDNRRAIRAAGRSRESDGR
jgi:hypothetical protein